MTERAARLPAHGGAGRRRSRSRFALRSSTRYFLAGLAGAVAVIGIMATAAFLAPDSMAQSASTTEPAAEKPPPKPKPKPKSKPAPAPAASATTEKLAQPQDQPQPASQPAAALANETPFLAHTRQAGLTTCRTVYPALGQLLTQGAEYMVQSKWRTSNPNAFPLQALVGMNYRSGSYIGPAFGTIFASPNGQRCEGDMIRVVPLQHDCQSAVAQLPQGSRQAANLSGIPVYDLPNGDGQAVLMSAGSGCVALTILSVGR